MNKNDERNQHATDSDSIVETLKDLVIMNKIMHDGLSEAQTMIGERELTIARLELQNQDLRNQLLMLIARAK